MSNSILDLPLLNNDCGAETVREYLKQLLLILWEKEECFNGKRPFGNSGWKWDIYTSLVSAGLIDGELDEEGYIINCDLKAADKMIITAIEELCK